MPKKTNALLSRLKPDRVKKLAEMCCDRVESLKAQLAGLHTQRDNYLLQSSDKFDYRKLLGEKEPEKPTAIFTKQNDSINIVGGLAEFMSARTIDDLLGSQPFFSVNPEGRNDKDFAETMQRHAEWRVRKSNLEEVFTEAIDTAYDIGECPVKIIYDQKMLYSERPANVLVDKSEAFVLTADGEYIFADDKIISEEVPTPEMQPDMEAMADAQTTPTAPRLRIYAEKAPDLDLAPFVPFNFMEVYVEENAPVGEPLTGLTLHHRDFLFPITARSLEEADFVAHLADFPLSEAKNKWKMDDETLAMIRDENMQPKSHLHKPNEDSFESEEKDIPYAPEEKDPIVQFAECYITTMVNGHNARLLAIVCLKSKTIVFADYLSNITPNGVLPFFMVRPYPVKNRIYGRGFFEIYSYAQDFIERHLNYIAYRNRHHANPTRIIKRDLIKGIATGDNINIDPDTTIEIEKGADKNDAISFVTYPDLDERTWQLMQMMIQVVQLRSGVTSAAQGGVESLPQNSTATGVEAILNSGNVLSRLPIRNIKHTLEDAMFHALKLIYTNLNEKEAFTYLEGEEARLLEISREQIAHLDFDLRMTMTRFREREQRENAQQAIATLMQYLQIPEQEKDTARPLFVEIIKSYGQPEAERIVRRALPPPDPATQAPPAL